MADDPLLQAQIDADLMARFVAQRDRFGWTNRLFIERLLTEALPRWEQAAEPKPRAKAAAE